MERSGSRASSRILRLAAVPIVVLAAGLAGPAHAQAPRPGAAGIGDPLFRGLGNGGYDADHYHLKLTYPSSTPQQTVRGTVTMLAKATHALSRFNLDSTAPRRASSDRARSS
jgi:hypothetical protein